MNDQEDIINFFELNDSNRAIENIALIPSILSVFCFLLFGFFVLPIRRFQDKLMLFLLARLIVLTNITMVLFFGDTNQQCVPSLNITKMNVSTISQSVSLDNTLLTLEAMSFCLSDKKTQPEFWLAMTEGSHFLVTLTFIYLLQKRRELTNRSNESEILTLFSFVTAASIMNLINVFLRLSGRISSIDSAYIMSASNSLGIIPIFMLLFSFYDYQTSRSNRSKPNTSLSETTSYDDDSLIPLEYSSVESQNSLYSPDDDLFLDDNTLYNVYDPSYDVSLTPPTNKKKFFYDEPERTQPSWYLESGDLDLSRYEEIENPLYQSYSILLDDGDSDSSSFASRPREIRTILLPKLKGYRKTVELLPFNETNIKHQRVGKTHNVFQKLGEPLMRSFPNGNSEWLCSQAVEKTFLVFNSGDVTKLRDEVYADEVRKYMMNPEQTQHEHLFVLVGSVDFEGKMIFTPEKISPHKSFNGFVFLTKYGTHYVESAQHKGELIKVVYGAVYTDPEEKRNLNELFSDLEKALRSMLESFFNTSIEELEKKMEELSETLGTSEIVVTQDIFRHRIENLERLHATDLPPFSGNFSELRDWLPYLPPVRANYATYDGLLANMHLQIWRDVLATFEEKSELINRIKMVLYTLESYKLYVYLLSYYISKTTDISQTSELVAAIGKADEEIASIHHRLSTSDWSDEELKILGFQGKSSQNCSLRTQTYSHLLTLINNNIDLITNGQCILTNPAEENSERHVTIVNAGPSRQHIHQNSVVIRGEDIETSQWHIQTLHRGSAANDALIFDGSMVMFKHDDHYLAPNSDQNNLIASSEKYVWRITQSPSFGESSV